MPILLMLLLALLPASAAPGEQDAALPADLQLTLLAKVLSYDRAMPADGEVVIAVVHQRALPASARTRDAWLHAAAASPDLRIRGARVQVVTVEYTSAAALPAALAAARADIAFLAPLRAADIGTVAAAARAAGVRTAGGGGEHSRATGVSLVLRAGRPHIVINLPLARRERSDFSAQLLRLAEVIT